MNRSKLMYIKLHNILVKSSLGRKKKKTECNTNFRFTKITIIFLTTAKEIIHNFIKTESSQKSVSKCLYIVP